MPEEEQDQNTPDQPASPEQPDPAQAPEAAAEEALDAASQAVDDLADQAGEAAQAEQGNQVVNAAIDAAQQSGDPGASPFDLPSIEPGAADGADESLELLSDVNLNVKVELGRTRMLVEDVLRLNEGAVVELDKLAGDPVDIYVNDQPVARGEVLVLNDNFCVRVNEIVSNEGLKRERA